MSEICIIVIELVNIFLYVYFQIRGQKQQKTKNVPQTQVHRYQKAKPRESELDAEKPKVRQM